MAAPYDLVIARGTLVTGTGRRATDVAIADGRIAAVREGGAFDTDAAAERIDATSLHVLPGVVDAHVHFRQPGLEHKEDWLTGSRAAVHGGVTTVLEMPNTVPPMRSVDHARAKLALADGRSYCDFGLFGLVDRGGLAGLDALVGSGLVVGLKVFLGPTTGELAAPPDIDLLRALQVARRAGLRTAFHAEDAVALQAAQAAAAGRTDPLAHLDARPVEAEVAAIDHAGRLLADAGAAGHILHLSSAPGVEAVRRWRQRGVDLTCEVTPHHLFLQRSDYDRLGGLVKTNPPVRGEPHASALLAALAEGAIDLVASDHAPHAPAEKSAPDIRSVEAGVPGVETLLPLLLTAVAEGSLTLERLVEAIAQAPARTWGLSPAKGSLEVGADADLVLVDLERPATIHATELHGKQQLTPFAGRSTQGGVVATIVRGRVVVRSGQLLGEPGWGDPVGRGTVSRGG